MWQPKGEVARKTEQASDCSSDHGGQAKGNEPVNSSGNRGLKCQSCNSITSIVVIKLIYSAHIYFH